MGRTSPPRSVLITIVAALVVAVGAQVAATFVTTESTAEQDRPRDDAGCGAGQCRVLASAVVNGMSVDLLADSTGTAGRLRAGGGSSGANIPTRLTARGVQLNHNSLRCSASPTPVCLVRGLRGGDMVGELHVWRGDSWKRPPRTFFSDAGMIVLDDVIADAMPEVVRVRHHCGAGPMDDGDGGGRAAAGSPAAATTGSGGASTGAERNGREPGARRCARTAPVLAEVLDLQGLRAGCTDPRDNADDLRGWPEVDLRGSDVQNCPRS